MIVKGIKLEDFINYKKPNLFIAMPFCSFKCGWELCQNSSLALSEDVEIPVKRLLEEYFKNDITKAIVFGGLEPLDSFPEILDFIKQFRTQSQDPVVIYTGYTEQEAENQVQQLKEYSPIIFKFGRFIPNQKAHYDKVLGVNLASDNQYGKEI